MTCRFIGKRQPPSDGIFATFLLVTKATSKASSSSTAEENEKLNMLRADLRSKIPGLEYLEGKICWTCSHICHIINSCIRRQGVTSDADGVNQPAQRRLGDRRLAARDQRCEQTAGNKYLAIVWLLNWGLYMFVDYKKRGWNI